jgi:RNA polymerase sigma-70 factor (ECF subfamily)
MEQTSEITQDPKELIAQAKNGDAEAFGKLYNLYYTQIFRYIYFQVRNKHEAEDLAQTVFLKVFRSITAFQEKASPLGYFYTVARNTVIDHWRKKKEVALEDMSEFFANIPGTHDNPRESAEKKELGETIHEAIGHLTQKQREIVMLKFINELSNREIAGLLDKTEEAIRQLQFRALKTLRERFRNDNIIFPSAA